MVLSSRALRVAPLGVALLFGGCDLFSGPDGGNTRIFLRQAGADGASFSVSVADEVAADRKDDRNRGPVLALVESLDVTITAVQAQGAEYVDEPFDFSHWETLTFGAPVTVDLLSLPTDENGLEIINGDLPPGAYVRLRFLVSEAELVLRAPLTIGKYTYPAYEPISIWIPDPWIRVPGAFFTVTDDDGAIIHVEFDPGKSLGQIVVGPKGQLTLTPVFRGHRWFDDRHWRD